MSLDDDLAAWAATVRLPDADAAAIFQRIVAAPVGLSAGPSAAPQLSPSWWRRYNAGFAARMVASTAPVRLAA
jgi:hypothetical protein